VPSVCRLQAVAYPAGGCSLNSRTPAARTGGCWRRSRCAASIRAPACAIPALRALGCHRAHLAAPHTRRGGGRGPVRSEPRRRGRVCRTAGGANVGRQGAPLPYPRRARVAARRGPGLRRANRHPAETLGCAHTRL